MALLSREKLKSAWNYIRNTNPFVALAIAIAISLLAPGDSSVYSLISNRSQLRKLENEKKHILKELENDRVRLDQLTYRKDRLEKFAREKYLMKEEDEDIYLLEDL